MSANLRAFLALIRWCEGTAGDDGYRTLVGGSTFRDWSDHPRKIVTIQFGQRQIHSSAAGAYQFLSRTWDEAAKALGLPDFSPGSQDQAAIWLIQRRGALQAVEDGDLRRAIALCNREWASLPGSPYGQPTKTYEACERVYLAAGGQLMQAPVAEAPPGPSPPPTLRPAPAPDFPTGSGDEPFPRWPFAKEARMPPLIAAAASSLLPVVVDLFRMRGSATTERNAVLVEKLGPSLVEVAKAVAPGVNEQDTVEKILASDELKATLRASVAMRMDEFAPAVDLILKLEEAQRVNLNDAAARMAEMAKLPAEKLLPFYFVAGGQLMLTLLVMLGLGALLYPIVSQVASGADVGELPSWASMIIGSLLIVIALEWRSIIQFVVGTTQGSSAKNSIIERLSEK